MSKSSILLVGNYSNDTGYAWNNIYRLFNMIGRQFRLNGYGVNISFKSINEPITCIDKEAADEIFKLPPYPCSLSDFQSWRKHIKNNNIKYIYFTDHGAIDWRYYLLRVMGIQRIVVHNRISVADPFPAERKTGIHGFFNQCKALCTFTMADRVYAVSDFVKSRLNQKERIPEDRVVKIMNGINIESYCPSKKERNNLDPLHIFVAGRATRFKGIHVLIEAISSIIHSSKQEDFIVRYAGHGPDLIEFKRLADELNLSTIFEFLGEVPSIKKFIDDSDIVIVPSIWGDACPSTVSEALASGKALIATRVGGVPEIVGDENNALLIPPNDPESLKSALLELLSNRQAREKLGQNARKRAEEALDERVYHQKVFEQLCLDFKLK